MDEFKKKLLILYLEHGGMGSTLTTVSRVIRDIQGMMEQGLTAKDFNESYPSQGKGD